MKTRLIGCGVCALAACAEPSDLGDRTGALGPRGDREPGGWDYNNNRFNSAVDGLAVGPEAPYGRAGLNALDPYTNVLFHLRPSETPACESRDPTITQVTVVGSARVGGVATGPRVMVHRGASVSPLGVGEVTTVAALMRTQAMSMVEAVPVSFSIERVYDFKRPNGWTDWPQYAVTMRRATDCATSTWIGVSIFGPAMSLPTSTAPSSLGTIADAVVPYAGFYDKTDPSLMAKSAVNLDAPLNFPGEPVSSGQGCLSGTAVAANHLAFLGALVTGAAVVTNHPDDPEQRPVVVFRTRKGQPFRAIASVMAGAVAQTLCHRNDLRPPGSLLRVASAKLSWPLGQVTAIDVIHGSGSTLPSNEHAASQFTWLASGTNQARKYAYLESSDDEDRYVYSDQADEAISAVAIKGQVGAIGSWNLLNNLLADRAALVIVAETLPPERASEGAEYATDQLMLNPVPNDQVCSLGELASGSADCPVLPPQVPES